MTNPVFGLSIQQVDEGATIPVWGDLSVIGLIGTAPDAISEHYPLNVPIYLNSRDATAVVRLGATGTLPAAIALINEQLGPFGSSAKVVLIRVEAGANAKETITNIVGNGSTTGLAAFLDAGSVTGHTPRLIGAPGFTSQRETGVDTVAVTAQGSGYTSAPTVAFSGGGGSGAAATAVVEDGKIVEVVVTNKGTGYTSAPTVSFSGGAGTGGTATATTAQLANAVCASLPQYLNALLAHAVVDGPATTPAAALSWRQSLTSERIIPVDPGVKRLSNGATVTGPLSPAILGLAVRRDGEYGGRPFHSWANQPVAGILGPSQNYRFSLTDGATAGQTLLAANIGILVRSEMGVDGGIGSGGFVFVGTDNAGDDELWRFYNVTRGRDYIHLMLLKTLRTYLGRFNVTAQAIQAILNTMDAGLRDLKAEGDILDFNVRFDGSFNSPEEIRAGRIVVSFAAEESPVLRHITVRSERMRTAVDALISDLEVA